MKTTKFDLTKFNTISRALLRRSVNANNTNADVSDDEDSEDNFADISDDVINREEIPNDKAQIDVNQRTNANPSETASSSVNKPETLRCDQEGCNFESTSNNGLSVHKGRVHKQD